MLVAGGCFWCVEADLEKVDGVVEVVSGYAGGRNVDPTYKTYDKGGHREVALVQYDPSVISFEDLATIFIRTIDVTDDGGQFCDRGYGYSTAVYYANEREQEILEVVLAKGSTEIGEKIVTPIEARPMFYAAEGYHQDFYKKSRFRYSSYRAACGRDRTVRFVWGQSGPDYIKKRKDQS
ncbi:MAG: peptide-methionine (S)-S-oxide reductase MsrA [Parvularculaceae bacterium]|nr:peptide-methionine (S)-S-oxide reductase MsrA [Parvularculaceae bacterium]